MVKNILVPLDGSKVAESALPYARLLAQKLGCDVELLQVIDPAADVGGSAGRTGENPEEQAGRSADRYLSEIAGSFAHSRARVQVRHGIASEVIIETAGRHPETLIVMASHGRSGIGRWLLGSVAEKVLRAGISPLLLVRASDAAPASPQAALHSIVVPLDGSKLAEAALDPALELVRSLQIELVLASAYEIPATAYYRGDDDVRAAAFIPTRDELVEAMSRETRTYLDAKVKEVSAQAPAVRGELLEGPAAERIIDLARRTKGSLIAMCTHGRSGLRRWVLGSVTEKVARHAESPVLIVRAR